MFRAQPENQLVLCEAISYHLHIDIDTHNKLYIMCSRILEEKGEADISLTLLILLGSPNLKKGVTLT